MLTAVFIDEFSAKETAERSKLSELISFGNGKSRPKTDGTIPVYGGNGLRGYTEETTHEGEHLLIGRQGALCGKGIIRLCHFMRVVAVTISSANSHPRNYSTEPSVVVTVEINELLFCRPCSGRNAQTGQPAAYPKWSGRRSLWRKARHTVRPVVPRQAVRALQSR